jgi:AMP-binding enzyme C-terminal domain/AMP-binding enzyme/Phosphopantetheine attachment site
VARHYFNRAAITAERFVDDPYAGGPSGGKLYRTGDLARHLPDGAIQFLGRIDRQIKLRGYRIEPGEIEDALGQHAGVQTAAVLAREDVPGKPYLVAYYTTPPAGHGPDAAELRHFLQEKLPAYMIPARFVAMAEMPMTPSKKVDRAALPAATGPGVEEERAFVPPRDDLEHVLAATFAEVLHLGRPVGAADNFLELGGDSLLAAQVVARLRDTLRIGVSLPQLFLARDVAALADSVRGAAPGGQADKIASLVRRLQGMSDEDKQALRARSGR